MIATKFNPLSWADSYAKRHQETDPGICDVYYLPDGASEREIRLIEVNEVAAIRDAGELEPIVFGYDVEGDDAHTVKILDINPDQWARIGRGKLRLPVGWSLDNMQPFHRG